MKQPSPYPVYPITDLKDLLVRATERYPDRIALKSKKKGSYFPITYLELQACVRQMASAFSILGLEKGDRVSILSENRTEWVVTYLAAISIGVIAVPIDRDLVVREICQILSVARPKVLICSQQYVSQLTDHRQDIADLQYVICMDDLKAEADLTFEEFLEKGKQALLSGDEAFDEVVVEEEDVASIIFTSGTTGSSKGVMLTHGNLSANVMAISQYVSIRNGVALSVLPLHHTYECTAGLLVALYQGCTICHAESLRRIPDNLRETQATVLLGVPLLFESLYHRIENAIQQNGRRKFQIAKGIAAAFEGIFGLNIRRQLFKQVHQNLGGHLQLFISGGAAINPEVSKSFRELGIDCIQGYGLTESAPIISVNRVDCLKDDSVGLPLPGFDIRIEDGEIVVRGPSVMKGYYLNEGATQETIKNGWLYTGDLGYLDEDGFLHISGRRKSVIVTSNGKNIYPEEIEMTLNQSPFILESLVWGGPEKTPDKVEVQAIVVPDSETFDARFGLTHYDEDQVQEVLAEEVKKCCKSLAPYKRVQNIVVRSQEFEKTTTRKIKRFLYTERARKPVTE